MNDHLQQNVLQPTGSLPLGLQKKNVAFIAGVNKIRINVLNLLQILNLSLIHHAAGYHSRYIDCATDWWTDESKSDF
jgi:hypothetical protein